MRRWTRNRVLAGALTLMNGAFWLCLRDGRGGAAGDPLLRLAGEPGFRLAALGLLGVTLCWLAHACGARGGRLRALALGGGAGYGLYRGACALLGGWLEPGRAALELVAVCAGAGLGCLAALRAGEAEAPEADGERASLEPLSARREPLMGCAILYVLLFHTQLTGAAYPWGLRQFVRFGFAGVDLFLLLSGMGMVRSLERAPGTASFYARRARRIYPEAVPWMLIYSLACMAAGCCALPLLIANCLGLGYWFSAGPGAFNWYISAILLFYLLAPALYRLLRRREGRGARAAALLALSLLPGMVAVDLLGRWRLLMALHRLPVFLLGMLAGFGLREGEGLSRAERRWMLPLALVFALGSLASIAEDYPALGWMYLCSGASMALASLPLAERLGKLRPEGALARLLNWAGESSLSLYLCNVLLVRLYGLATEGNAWSGGARLACTLGVAAANLLLVRGLQAIGARARKRRARR